MTPVAAVLAVVVRGDAVVLVRRRNPPNAGLWGFPGGRIEGGETVAAAAEREMLEETGVAVDAGPVVAVLDALGEGHHFILIAVACAWRNGEPAAADDALEARWLTLAQIDDLGAAVIPRVKPLAERALSG